MIRPLGPNHALLCGLVTGQLSQIRTFDYEAEPEIDGNDYTGRTLIHRPSGTWAVEVVPVEVDQL